MTDLTTLQRISDKGTALVSDYECVRDAAAEIATLRSELGHSANLDPLVHARENAYRDALRIIRAMHLSDSNHIWTRVHERMIEVCNLNPKGDIR